MYLLIDAIVVVGVVGFFIYILNMFSKEFLSLQNRVHKLEDKLDALSSEFDDSD